MGTSFCPHCHQPMREVRLGNIPLPERKARIFDLIKARPGISRKQLCELVYGEVTEAHLTTIGSHVTQLRDLMIGSGYTIKGGAWNGLSLAKEESVDAP